MTLVFYMTRPLWRRIQFRALFCCFFYEGVIKKFYRLATEPRHFLESKYYRKSVIMKRLNDQKVQLDHALPGSTMRTSYTIAVEGNIGSGKSTLLQHFNLLPDTEVVEEPLHKWTNVQGHNALAMLYDDPERWTFSFNMYAMLTRVQMHTAPHTCAVKMLERSLYSTRYCFIQNSYLGKTINGFEYAVLNQWFDYLTKAGRADVDLIVYLRADPETCYERLRERSRQEEAGVPLSFIRSLHDLHEDWLIAKKYPVPAPVLILDANHDLEQMKKMYDLRQKDILCK